jgi:acetyl esterase/lipase
VRANAAKWRVDPDRIGMIGFSAGAMLTMATTLSNRDAKPEAAKPAFIGNIYGSLAAVEVPRTRRLSSRPSLPTTRCSPWASA